MESAEKTDDWFADENATFGDRVAAAREHLGMSEDDLAGRLGIKTETVRKWEHDLAEPRANKLQMLSGILNVSLRWLLTGVGDELESPGRDETSREVSELLRELRAVRGDVARSAERIGSLEKRLRLAFREA